MAEIIATIFWKKHSFYKIAIFEDYLLILKIGNDRVVENILPEIISQDLLKSNHYWKIYKNW